MWATTVRRGPRECFTASLQGMAPAEPVSCREAAYKLRRPVFAGRLGQEGYLFISRIGPGL